MSDGFPRYRQRQLLEANPALVVSKAEDHWFERKSVRVASTALANVLVGFANADGGTILVGVEDDGEVTGVDDFVERVNELRLAAINLTTPPVRHTFEEIPCITSKGGADHLLLIEVHPSDQLHRNQRGEVYKRYGDQTKRLGAEDARELAFDKGEHPFDGVVAPDVSLADLDLMSLRAFASSIGAGNDIQRALRVRGLVGSKDGKPFVTWGALLLFGNDPEAFLPGSFVRIMRYEGLRALPGTRSNLVFDRRLSASLPTQIEQARQVMLNQLREITRLNEETGQFIAIPEIPRFAWLEAIVNSVTHRSYSLQGDHIRVSLFDDRMEVESPGRLPGPVRVDNIRQTRYSRNPRVSRTLADLHLVQELNEGMNRMFDEMLQAGLPEPVLRQTDSGFRVTLFNSSEAERERVERTVAAVPPSFSTALDRLFTEGRISTGEAAKLTGFSLPTARRYLRELEEMGLLERVARSPRDSHAYWQFPQPLRGRWRVPALLGSERTRKLR